MNPKEWLSARKLGEGLGYGLGIATVYSVYVLVTVGFFESTALERMGLTLPRLIGTYYLGGVTGGVIYGLFYPLTRSAAGAGLTGYLVAIPFFVQLSYQLDTGPATRPVVVAVASLIGAAAGLWFWHDAQPEAWCPTGRTTAAWWMVAAIVMPLSWWVGVVRPPFGAAVAFSMFAFFAVAVSVILVTIMRFRASGERRVRADARQRSRRQGRAA